MPRKEKRDPEKPRNDMRYCHRVKTGNWLKETWLYQKKIQKYVEKKEKGDLAIQKLFKLYSFLTKEIPTRHQEGPLKYGDQIMLIAKDITFPEEYCGCSGAALSGLVQHNHLDSFKHFNDGSRVCCSIVLTPNMSNLFYIGGSDPHLHGKTLSYGKPFTLSPVESTSPSPLYLSSECQTLFTQLGRAGHSLVTLTTNVNRNIVWKVGHINPIFDDKPRPVMPNTKVVINHWASNMNLAAEDKYWIYSMFGRECEVTTFSYSKRNKMRAAENIWCIVAPNSNDAIPKNGVDPWSLRYPGIMPL